MNRLAATVMAGTLAAALVSCSSSDGDDQELLVFAAASLSGPLEEIVKAFESATDIRVDVSIGGSQMLAHQIASGAPADVFISAGERPMEFLRERDAVGNAIDSLLTNRLVVATPANLELEVTSLLRLTAPDIKRVALADPDLAPAGAYAKEALRAAGVWEAVKAKLVIGTDVRTTLTYVETGNAEAALVYSTDAALARNVRVADVVPVDSYGPVVYPVAVLEQGKNGDAATAFAEFLTGERSSRILEKYGFVPIN